MFTDNQITMLGAKLDRANVKQRVQGKATVSYIEGWHVISEANRIFGYGKWNRETVDLRVVSEKAYIIGKESQWPKDGWNVSYLAKVKITVGEAVREGIGCGHGIDQNLGNAHESAAKEAETDAMKRALMTFGNQFGLALYDKVQANVETVPPPVKEPVKKEPPPPVAMTPAEIETTKRNILDEIQGTKDLADLEGVFRNRWTVIKKLPKSYIDEITNAKDQKKAVWAKPAEHINSLPDYIGQTAETGFGG